MGVRFIQLSPRLESERFLVDLFLGHAEPQRRVDDTFSEPVRSADVDVALGYVGNEPSQQARVEADPVTRADDLMEPTAALPYQSTDLVTVDEILDGRCPDDDHHMDPAGQVLQQRAQRGDPYSGTNQRDAIRHADMARERSVGSLDGHAGSGLELTNGTA